MQKKTLYNAFRKYIVIIHQMQKILSYCHKDTNQTDPFYLFITYLYIYLQTSSKKVTYCVFLFYLMKEYHVLLSFETSCFRFILVTDQNKILWLKPKIDYHSSFGRNRNTKLIEICFYSLRKGYYQTTVRKTYLKGCVYFKKIK